jgi:hypothetical protein
MKIIAVEPSNHKGKRLKAFFDDGTSIHFGSKGATTFVDGATLAKRDSYLKRHIANETEKYLIHNLIPSPSLLAAYLLWNTDDLGKNIKILNRLLAENKR